MKALHFILMTVFAFGVLAPISIVMAEDFDYSRVINLAGKQRMLTQKMSKEAVLVALAHDAEVNTANLQKTHDLFDKTLKGLRAGDADLGLPETKKPNIVAGLDEVDVLWGSFGGVIGTVASSGAAEDAQLSTIASNNVPLLKAMNKVVKLYEADSASGDMNPALAVAINLSGRQRMLTQKMSKEFFLIAKGHEVDANRENLAKTKDLFDKTLNGLLEGDAEQGLSPAPTDEIRAQLEKVKGMWAEFKVHLEADPTPESIKAVADKNLPLLKEMNKAVGMFEAFG